MIIVKGWTNSKNFSVSGKCGNILTPHQAWVLVQTVKLSEEKIGHIRLVNRPERFEYIRLDNGRIVIRQI